MREKTPKDFDDIDFFYILENHGWSTCLIYIRGKIYSFGPTHIFNNPIEELLISLTALLNDEDEIKFKWFDEPGHYDWLIKRNTDQKHKIKVTITNAVQLEFKSHPELETISFKVKLKLFSLCVLKQMEKINDLLTEPSFKENKRTEFPYKEFKNFKLAFNSKYSI
jgi:hypothetical protein